jgi:hypothetical protein
MRQTEAAHVAQLDPLEVGPEAFPRIQLRGIGREALQVETGGCSIAQELSDDMAAMHGRPVPENDHPAGRLAQQVLQKGDHFPSIEGVILAMEIQLPLGRDGADGGEMIAGPPFLQDRRVPPGRIGADDTGQGIEARFVDEPEVRPLRLRPFWIAGHVSSRQRAIATSSRWHARRAGFCRLHWIAWHQRPTWTGWYERPNAKAMTAAMRPRVHTWPRQP